MESAQTLPKPDDLVIWHGYTFRVIKTRYTVHSGHEVGVNRLGARIWISVDALTAVLPKTKGPFDD